jgi:hypothetical protein
MANNSKPREAEAGLNSTVKCVSQNESKPPFAAPILALGLRCSILFHKDRASKAIEFVAPLRRQILMRLLVLTILAAGPASAFAQSGPPYITNDPSDLNWEININLRAFF